MTSPPSVTLGISGYRAVIEADRFVPDSFQLVVDGTPQSHVNVGDPSQLHFEYIQRIGHVIDELGTPGSPVTAIHLGAGAFTLPRYIDATRPGSRQQVLELETDLVPFVREHLPLPKRANIKVRYGDARESLGKLPAGLFGTADIVVVDIFGGSRTPAHVTSQEFYRLAASLLAPQGIMAINIADGPGLAFARGQAATVASVLPHVAAMAEAQVLKGRRFGNVVLVASGEPLPLDYIPRLLAGGPHPAQAVHGKALAEFIRSAPIVTDQTAVPSPPPNRSVFLAK
ncbi:spermine synthase [Leifsonia sp. ALI-44-B]|jgi:spermidine synthase|uniref:spermidine synthase n=1 Tax=Leifsonia sp. ALI-44-B TaxID=1933776 RepID=UPI00097BEC3D|nr:fused MFS/spermidine synthase [Leifsonia sp. ALI-44-B]ONI61374.1 spermine synthase [Leifsonia sp. ALI-44-B]